MVASLVLVFDQRKFSILTEGQAISHSKKHCEMCYSSPVLQGFPTQHMKQIRLGID